ncbi:MAG: hydrolase of the alpha/beta superfamily [Myxococcales bacterium]|nr:hydrolase of the alpha/beta superfamily [Myxococcales bacterium]
MASTELVARTADGVKLRIDHVRAVGTRRGVVVCLHAMMTDGRYFGARRDDGFAVMLAARGLDVFVADFRGHGRSVPPHAGKNDWSFDDLVELDLPAIIAASAEAAACAPSDLALLGHSLGGLVSCAALGNARIAAPRVLLLAATSVWLGETRGRRALMAVYRGITELAGRAPIRALRIGTADEARTYVEQLTGWARTGRWTSLRGVDYAESLANIATPTHAFASAHDWMCRPRDAEAIARRIPTCSALRIIGRAYGDALDPDHFELITRKELDTVGTVATYATCAP